MGQFSPGDVILASLRLGGAETKKTRPAVVITASSDGSLVVCPISSRASPDGSSVPLSLDDFARGGLDMFEESYILTAHRIVIRRNAVIAKKGKVTDEVSAAVASLVRHSGRR
ncbi:PemK-like protein [Methanoculleus taiwanensis]|uniref:PemK-like protein n=1 Tax=Methanoculleus taiwanensis TaxID=1550565 RepID=A0A498GZW5_9EURY|nr:type II toxin-antitoxin system PemK/MazF family toxin [Methanoculleus taiwanensis]RXE56072.1 PemK-like protein [Methanoculleus taiwanensis]